MHEAFGNTALLRGIHRPLWPAEPALPRRDDALRYDLTHDSPSSRRLTMSNFDIQPASPPPQPPQRVAAVQHCRYCGAPLNAFFYFCTGCGIAYKSIDEVVTPERPRELTEGELIQMKAPSVWPMFWTYMVVIVFLGFVSFALFSEKQVDLAMLLQMAGLFITTCVFATMYWTSLASQLRCFGFFTPPAWIALGLLIPALGLNWAWSTMWMELLESQGITGPPDTRETLANPLFRIMAIAVFPAITEEIAFRGLLQHWLQTAIKPWRAIILASFLFALLHFSVIGLPYLFLIGGLMGWAKWKSGSLYPSILIHFIHNLVVIELF